MSHGLTRINSHKLDLSNVEEPGEGDALLESQVPAPVYTEDSAADLAPPKKVAWWRRHWGKLLALAIVIILLILTFAVIVPKVAVAIMARLLQDSDIEVQEMEIKHIENWVATVRLQAIMSVNVNLEVSGYTEPTIMAMKMWDPMDRTKLGSIGRVFLPALVAEGTTVFLNITTQMYIDDDRLFHAFLTEALANATLITFLEGDLTMTAAVPIYGSLTASTHLVKEVPIDGMNGLEFELITFDYLNSTTDTLELLFHLNIYNPSQFYSSYAMQLYDVNLIASIEGVECGYMVPIDLLISKGWSYNQAEVMLIRTEENDAYIAKFLGDFIMGLDVPVNVQGTTKVYLGEPMTPDYPTFMNITYALPGNNVTLIPELYSPITEVSPFPPPISLQAQAILLNPLTFPIEVMHIELDAYVGDPCGRVVDHVSQSFDPPAYIPVLPEQECLALDIEVNSADFQCMLSGFTAGDLEMWVLNTIMTTKVGEFIIDVPFDYGPVYGEIGRCPRN